MNFKYKAFIQKWFSAIPKGEKLNYIFQKYITKSLPISDSDFTIKLDVAKMHFNNFKMHGVSKNTFERTYYEFGSGYDMLIPLSMSMLGFKKLICVDIRELVFPELINDSIQRLRKFKDKAGKEFAMTENIPSVTGKNYKEILEKYFRIKYIAPLDARNTGIESNSVDFILSNATMEHIPQKDLGDIMKECYRILRKGGVMSNVIDYRDHWSFFDKSISIYNYLIYSENEWKKFNPSIMYQNRMRHIDYIKIINEAKLEISKEDVNLPDATEIMELKKIKLHDYFVKNYSEDELSIKSSMLVLKKS